MGIPGRVPQKKENRLPRYYKNEKFILQYCFPKGNTEENNTRTSEVKFKNFGLVTSTVIDPPPVPNGKFGAGVSACPAYAGELRPGWPGLYYPLYYESIVQKKTLVKKPGRSSPKPPNVEPDFGRFEDIRRL